MSKYEGFDRVCDEWEAAHPGEDIPYGELFGQWLADTSGHAVLGGPVGEPPTIIAIPEGECSA